MIPGFGMKDTYKTEFAKNKKLDWNSVKSTSTLQNGEAVTGLPVILKEVEDRKILP